jgi:hypothetical protein
MKRLVWLLSILLLVPSVSGCGCDAILRVDRGPETVTVAVGETAPPPQASIYGCGQPRLTLRFDDWTSEHPNIASVTPGTGVITGVAPGKTRIIGYADENFGDAYSVPVTVVVPTATAR